METQNTETQNTAEEVERHAKTIMSTLNMICMACQTVVDVPLHPDGRVKSWNSLVTASPEGGDDDAVDDGRYALGFENPFLFVGILNEATVSLCELVNHKSQNVMMRITRKSERDGVSGCQLAMRDDKDEGVGGDGGGVEHINVWLPDSSLVFSRRILALASTCMQEIQGKQETFQKFMSQYEGGWGCKLNDDPNLPPTWTMYKDEARSKGDDMRVQIVGTYSNDSGSLWLSTGHPQFGGASKAVTEAASQLESPLLELTEPFQTGSAGGWGVSALVASAMKGTFGYPYRVPTGSGFIYLLFETAVVEAAGAQTE